MSDEADTGRDETHIESDGSGESEGAEAERTAGDVHATYSEADGERRLRFERDGGTAVVAQNIEGYAMLYVRPAVDGDELERYYGFDMALDHAGELLGVDPHELPVPEAAADMGM